ncbi:MAG: hypothetical protein H6981_01265 [Gammaproteobacteria bacterium]|nr:hypothetical protein [Gammaproteobacteria bacterium]MCP5135415.1 hypothetical protein [Gammaproteobacteria bacterium]
MIRWAVISVMPVALAGCTTLEPLDPAESVASIPQVQVTPSAPKTFLRVVTPERKTSEARVSLNLPHAALADALSDALPRHAILPMDAGVDLRKPISIVAGQLPVSDFLRYIAGITGYDVTLDGRTIRIASTSVKTWDLSAIATANTSSASISSSNESSSSASDGSSESSSESSGGRSTKLELSNADDAFQVAVQNSQRILGVSETDSGAGASTVADATGETFPPAFPAAPAQASSESNTPSDFAPRTWLAADRRLGTITAGGPPQRIRELDRYLSDLADRGLRQIHLSLIVVDVTWSNSVAQGLDWSAVFNDGRSSVTLNSSARSAIADSGTWAVTGSLVSGTKWTLNILTELLAKNARSYDITRGSITLLNGGSAYINVGEEFSYVADIEALADLNGNVTETATLGRLSVGTKFLVSARTTRNDRILIDLAPELSSVTRFDTLTSGSQTFQSPVVGPALTATQVISRSGRPVYVGGVTSDRVARALKQLPLAPDNPLNRVLGSSLDEQSHRELLFIITPTELAT